MLIVFFLILHKPDISPASAARSRLFTSSGHIFSSAALELGDQISEVDICLNGQAIIIGPPALLVPTQRVCTSLHQYPGSLQVAPSAGLMQACIAVVVLDSHVRTVP